MRWLCVYVCVQLIINPSYSHYSFSAFLALEETICLTFAILIRMYLMIF